MNPLDFLKDLLPSITIGQGLVLLVIIDLCILFVVVIKSIRKGGEPSKKKKAPTKRKPPQRTNIYYDLEENTEEPTDDALKDVAEALEGLPKPRYRFPTPPLDVPAHVEAMLQRAKHPNLFMSTDVQTGVPLPAGQEIRVVDPTVLPMVPTEKKKGYRDGFVV